MIWDEIAKGSDEAWFTHLNDWIEIEKQWGVISYSFIIEEMGVVPLFLVNKKGFRYLTSGYKGWGGPAMLFISPNKAFAEIDRIAKQLKVDWIEIKYPSLTHEKNILIDYGYIDISGKTSIIDLTYNEETLLKNIDKKSRYEIRKAEKIDNIHITEAKSLEDIKEYYKLHCDNYKRTNTIPNPLWYYEELWKRFYSKGIIKFLFIEENGKKVVGASIAICKKKAIYLTGAVSEEARNKGLNHYLQWIIIKGLHRAGIKYYEIGEIEDTTEKAKNLGHFKKSFGGKIYPIYKGLKIYRPIRFKLYKLLRKIKLWSLKK
jgi:hypothetical protein